MAVSEKTSKEVKNKTKKFIYAKGARKNAVAQVRLYLQGEGKLTVNQKKINEYFPNPSLQKKITNPLEIAGRRENIDCSIKVHGSGLSSQAEACRHGISRALVKLDQELKPIFKAEKFLTRDPRMKERKKPGLKRARRSPQWSKR